MSRHALKADSYDLSIPPTGFTVCLTMSHLKRARRASHLLSLWQASSEPTFVLVTLSLSAVLVRYVIFACFQLDLAPLMRYGV